MTPRTFRPRRATILSVAKIINTDAYLDMSQSEFVARAMKETGGSGDIEFLCDLYDELVGEAGPQVSAEKLNGTGKSDKLP